MTFYRAAPSPANSSIHASLHQRRTTLLSRSWGTLTLGAMSHFCPIRWCVGPMIMDRWALYLCGTARQGDQQGLAFYPTSPSRATAASVHQTITEMHLKSPLLPTLNTDSAAAIS